MKVRRPLWRDGFSLLQSEGFTVARATACESWYFGTFLKDEFENYARRLLKALISERCSVMMWRQARLFPTQFHTIFIRLPIHQFDTTTADSVDSISEGIFTGDRRFDTKEELRCACWLDTQAQQGRIKYWIRNLVRREGCSFFLQKADGRFYPDFLCLLPADPGGTEIVLVVEYKGGDRWAGAKDDRLIGGLWAELSEGRCRFVMVKDMQWENIDELLPTTQ